MSFRSTVIILFSWRVLVSLITIAGIAFLPYRPTFPYAFELLPSYGPRWLTTWAQFDGVHYLTIADKGYAGTGLIQAFFPLYPLLIRWLSLTVLNQVVVGIIISTASFMIGMWILYRLIQMDETEMTARKVLVLVLLFPTAFFFTAVYNEGLFFLLSVWCFYLARKRQWFLAGLIGALAATTRLVGVLLVFGLLIEYYMYSKKHVIKINTIIACLLPLLGLGTYMAYLGRMFDDPLLFYRVQAAFGAGRESSIVLLPRVFIRYIKMFTTLQPDLVLWYRTSLEFVSGIFGLLLLLMAFWKTRLSYAVYAFLAYLLPTLTGNFSSLPRYLLPLFPIFIVMAKLTDRKGYFVTIGIFVILQIVNVLLFTQGVFIS